MVVRGPAHCTASTSLCRLCDDSRRQVELQLALDISVSAELLHTALFTWNEDAASSEFRELVAALAVRRPSSNADTAVGAAAYVAPLKILLSCRKFHNFDPDAASPEQRHAIVDVLDKILSGHTPYAGPFRVERVTQLEQAHHLPHVRRLACQTLVPVELTIPPRARAPGHASLAAWPATYEPSQCVWEWLMGLDPLAPEEVARVHATAPKIAGARIHRLEEIADGPTFARVCSVFSLSPWLKTLELTSDVTRDARNAFELGHALFSRASSLRLTRLGLTLDGSSDDGIASFIAGAGIRNDRMDEDTWAHKVVDLAVVRVSDAAFAGFMQVIGRRTRDLVVKTLAARQLQLLLTISCSTIKRVDVDILGLSSSVRHELASALVNPDVETLKLEHLSVRVVSPMTDATEELHVLLAVLRALGPSLRTLRWSSMSPRITRGAEVAACLVRHCNALHTVALDHTDDTFVVELADAYGRRACRIARLRLDLVRSAHSALPRELLPVLGDSTQPIECFVWRHAQPEPTTLEKARECLRLLNRNPRLVNLVCVSPVGLTEDERAQLVDEYEATLATDVAIYPSRRRQLALLSVLAHKRHKLFPQHLVIRILRLCSRHPARSIGFS
ncbi:hypothetical protein PINS_up016907 [Pythium insidiosum]|nr:hypothetical protein PINS_up016907 [Pythium insidiosum]